MVTLGVSLGPLVFSGRAPISLFIEADNLLRPSHIPTFQYEIWGERRGGGVKKSKLCDIRHARSKARSVTSSFPTVDIALIDYPGHIGP